MNYILRPTLELRALIKIAEALWNQDDIIQWVREDRPITESSAILTTVKRKISKLFLPEAFKDKLTSIIKPMGQQVMEWNKFHPEYRLYGKYPKRFFWTSHGTVDVEKMIKGLIVDESIDIVIRFGLACVYCIEEAIDSLWDRIPKERWKLIYRADMFRPDIMIHWTNDLIKRKGIQQQYADEINEGKSCSYFGAFKRALYDGNSLTVKYTFQKLTEKDKEVALNRSIFSITRSESLIPRFLSIIPSYVIYGNFPSKAPNEYLADISVFLLQHMNEEQQRNAWRMNSGVFLKYLLNWPWQSFFLEESNRFRDWCLTTIWDAHYADVLRDISFQVNERKYCSYQELFTTIWNYGTTRQKKYVIGMSARGTFLTDLFIKRQKENISLILTYMSDSETVEMIEKSGKNVCELLIGRKDWDLLKHFVHESISTKDPSSQQHLKLRIYEMIYKILLKTGMEKNILMIETRQF